MTTYFDVDLTVASDGSLTWTHGGTILSRNDELDLSFIEGMYQGSGPYNEVRISFAPPTQWKDCQAGASASTAPLTHAIPQAGESEGFAFCINSAQRAHNEVTAPTRLGSQYPPSKVA